MKCSSCNKFIKESSVIDSVEYFVCPDCGNCVDLDLKPQKLSLHILHRKGCDNTHESYSSGFIVDESPLLDILSNNQGEHADYLGCFARGWDKLNEHSKRQLLLLEAPKMVSGRRLIYVCPECADVGCGAYGCIIRKEDNVYIWESFAYENGYEEPQVLVGVGPFRFEISEYEQVIDRAYKL
ncbi:hypothetical protein [Rheinheimera sp. MM224]|uniref:hypothetical protein n=1 Tax=Rheinheimera sp. MM224 TaxID=3019969 RepID=UPI0021F8D418|nr:hypothetical protein [Rheinheimera sp. MM224]CAI3806385.1 hypothetical protein JAMGFMIE_04164 [Rheinheimera sp. MM224]